MLEISLVFGVDVLRVLMCWLAACMSSMLAWMISKNSYLLGLGLCVLGPAQPCLGTVWPVAFVHSSELMRWMPAAWGSSWWEMVGLQPPGWVEAIQSSFLVLLLLLFFATFHQPQVSTCWCNREDLIWVILLSIIVWGNGHINWTHDFDVISKLSFLHQSGLWTRSISIRWELGNAEARAPS